MSWVGKLNIILLFFFPPPSLGSLGMPCLGCLLLLLFESWGPEWLALLSILGVMECHAPVLWQKGPWGITRWLCPHHLRSVPCHHPFSQTILSFGSLTQLWLPTAPHFSWPFSEWTR